MRVTLAATIACVLLTVAPAGVGVHGEAYDAYGIATRCGEPTVVGPIGPLWAEAVPNPTTCDGVAYLAEAHWSGYDWTSSCIQCMTVVIRDTAGNPLVTEQFPAYWTAQGPVLYYFETLVYHAWATDGSAHFDIKGVQNQQVVGGGPNKAIMLYVGNYKDYALTLVVDGYTPLPF